MITTPHVPDVQDAFFPRTLTQAQLSLTLGLTTSDIETWAKLGEIHHVEGGPGRGRTRRWPREALVDLGRLAALKSALSVPQCVAVRVLLGSDWLERPRFPLEWVEGKKLQAFLAEPLTPNGRDLILERVGDGLLVRWWAEETPRLLAKLDPDGTLLVPSARRSALKARAERLRLRFGQLPRVDDFLAQRQVSVTAINLGIAARRAMKAYYEHVPATVEAEATGRAKGE